MNNLPAVCECVCHLPYAFSQQTFCGSCRHVMRKSEPVNANPNPVDITIANVTKPSEPVREETPLEIVMNHECNSTPVSLDEIRKRLEDEAPVWQDDDGWIVMSTNDAAAITSKLITEARERTRKEVWDWTLKNSRDLGDLGNMVSARDLEDYLLKGTLE